MSKGHLFIESSTRHKCVKCSVSSNELLVFVLPYKPSFTDVTDLTLVVI